MLPCKAGHGSSIPPTPALRCPPQQPDVDPAGEPPVQILRVPRCFGREPDRQGSGPRGGDALSRLLIASLRYGGERAGTQPEVLVGDTDQGGEGPHGHTRVARDELEAGDSGRAVRVLGGRSARDA